jgi:hypothetical protein
MNQPPVTKETRRKPTLVRAISPIVALLCIGSGTAAYLFNKSHDNAVKQTTEDTRRLSVPEGCVAALREERDGDVQGAVDFQVSCKKVHTESVSTIRDDIDREINTAAERTIALVGFAGSAIVGTPFFHDDIQRARSRVLHNS